MVTGGKIIAFLMFSALAISLLKTYAWILFGVLGAWYLIRFIADIFWWGKDNDKW